MDLNTVTVIARPRSRDEIKLFAEGDAYLAGGTWLFSEPQPQLRRLIDLTTLGWQSLVANEAGLSIAATCTVAELDAFEPPVAWGAATLIGQCCRSFLASFKICLLRCVRPQLAPLRHADCIEQCPLSGVTRKTFAHTEFFSV